MILSMMFWSDDQTGPKSVSSCANGYVQSIIPPIISILQG